MVLVKKSPGDTFVALVIVVFNLFAVGFTFWGVFRRFVGETDETWVTSDHLVLTGNIFQSVALFGTLYFLTKSDAGLLTGGLGVAMIILLVLVLYMSQGFTTPNQDNGVHITVLLLLVSDFLVKTYSLLLGFGVCSVTDITQMASTIGGALRRRR